MKKNDNIGKIQDSFKMNWIIEIIDYEYLFKYHRSDLKIAFPKK